MQFDLEFERERNKKLLLLSKYYIPGRMSYIPPKVSYFILRRTLTYPGTPAPVLFPPHWTAPSAMRNALSSVKIITTMVNIPCGSSAGFGSSSL